MPVLGSIAIVAAGIFFWTTSELFTVRGPSMLPTFSPGDRVWVSSLTSAPSRFDVVVVKREERHFLKRVLGLSGERIRFQQGDLFVDGQRYRQGADAPWRPRGVWSGLPTDKPWRREENDLVYHEPLYAAGYLQPGVRTTTGIPQEDLRLTLELTLDGSEAFSVALRRSDGEWTIRFGPGGYPLAAGKHTVVCWVRDGAYGVTVDGTVVEQGTYEKRDTPTGPIWPTPIILSGLASMSVHAIRLEEDGYYFTPADTGTEVVVPEDGLFLVGDNTFESKDSRHWGAVPRSQVDGVVIGVFDGE
jgi:signal peptidase I